METKRKRGIRERPKDKMKGVAGHPEGGRKESRDHAEIPGQDDAVDGIVIRL